MSRLRVLRTAPLYEDYLRLGNSAEVTWESVKSIKSALTPNRWQWKPLFQATGFHPVALLNAVAQSSVFPPSRTTKPLNQILVLCRVYAVTTKLDYNATG